MSTSRDIIVTWYITDAEHHVDELRLSWDSRDDTVSFNHLSGYRFAHITWEKLQERIAWLASERGKVLADKAGEARG